MGGGGHCRSVIDVIETSNEYRILGIVDRPENVGKNVLGYEIVGTDEDLPRLREFVDYALVTVGQVYSAQLRIRLYDLLKGLGFTLPVVVSPFSYVSKHCRIGNGSTIMHGVVINSNVEIGENSIINTKALIEHDSIVGDHCHISTGAVLNGGVRVGNESFIGSGAIVVQNVAVPPRTFVKAGSLVK